MIIKACHVVTVSTFFQFQFFPHLFIHITKVAKGHQFSCFRTFSQIDFYHKPLLFSGILPTMQKGMLKVSVPILIGFGQSGVIHAKNKLLGFLIISKYLYGPHSIIFIIDAIQSHLTTFNIHHYFFQLMGCQINHGCSQNIRQSGPVKIHFHKVGFSHLLHR